MTTKKLTTTDKKSFILYKDSANIVEQMSMTQAGALFKAIYHYQATGIEIDVGSDMQFVLKMFITTFVRDDAKYATTCANRSKAGIKGAKQKLAKAGKRKHKVATQADSDSDSESDIGSDSESEEKAFVAPRQEEGLESKTEQQSSPASPLLAEEKKRHSVAAFERCWVKYKRKGSKAKALRYWNRLSDGDHADIEQAIPAYVMSNDLCYLKNFEGWINPANRMWEDLVVVKDDTSQARPISVDVLPPMV